MVVLYLAVNKRRVNCLSIQKYIEFLKNKLNKKFMVKVIAIILALLVLLEVGACFIIHSAVFTTGGAPSFARVEWKDNLNNKWLKDNAQKVTLENRDGKEITALELKNKVFSDSYVILCHPYGKTSYSMGDFAKHFYDLGFNILLPDARGYGDSPYKYISMGYLDRLDVVDWVNSIVEKDENARIILFGVSMGGACVAGASGEDLPSNVKCVVADSCYATVYDLMKEEVEDNFGLPALLTANILSLLNRVKCGWDFKDGDILKLVENTELPILFIHGENDEVVFIKQSNDLFMACENEDREQYVINEGSHGMGYMEDSERYWITVDEFMLNHLTRKNIEK